LLKEEKMDLNRTLPAGTLFKDLNPYDLNVLLMAFVSNTLTA
jgi:hypothetical protein